MPRRNDIRKIMVIGSGPIVIGQALRVRLLGHPGRARAARRGLRGGAGQLEPGDHHDRPRAGRAHLRRADHGRGAARRSSPRSGPTRSCPRSAGRPRSTSRSALAAAGILDKYGVKLIGASVEAIEKAEDRELFKAAMEKIGLEVPRSGYARSLEEALAVQATFAGSGYPVILRPSFTLGGMGGGIAYNADEFDEKVRVGAGAVAARAGPGRGVGARLEGVRARGDARPRRQRGHHLLDREPRSDGRAHRRLDHRRARR